MIMQYGNAGISATLLAHSICNRTQKQIYTFELVYPRAIHSELMTHRLFSRNAASSRAIPVKRKLKHIKQTPFVPLEWGQNKKGMQADKEVSLTKQILAETIWLNTMRLVSHSVGLLNRLGIHKQIANRLIEPWEMYKVIMTTTELDNFMWLRNHEAAQPEIQKLARCMQGCTNQSTPFGLNGGEWHLPYVKRSRTTQGDIIYSDNNGDHLFVEDAKMISVSCCAQVSYRRLNDNIEKAKSIYNRLIESEPAHYSPTEHQATPISKPKGLHNFEDYLDHGGVTHMDCERNIWSGNFKGWIQNRQLIQTAKHQQPMTVL